MTPALAGYRAKRRERNRPPVSPATWHLLRRQHGRCPLCRGLLLYASHEPHDEREWEQWHNTIRKAIRKEAITAVMDLGTPGEQAAYHLIHADCRQRTGSTRPAPASSP
jgi:RNA-directed DNA polymerase